MEDSFYSGDNEKTMMEKWSRSLEIKSLSEIYPKGTRVRLIEMNDPCAPPVGTEGTVPSHVLKDSPIAFITLMTSVTTGNSQFQSSRISGIC